MTSTIVADFPAYQIIDMNQDVIRLTAEDAELQEFAAPHQTRNHGTLYNMLLAGSVRTYARKHRADEVAAVERAKRLGHKLFWLINLPVMLTAEKRAKTTKVLLKDGQKIELDGTLLVAKHTRDIYWDLVEIK
jgi:hypothetical protein